MADKDINDVLEKILMSYGDVFADCENALIFGGEQRIRAEHLVPAPTESYYRGRERMHNQFVDVSAYLVENGEIMAQFLIGNETAVEARQVLRKASYQGGAYRAQLESGKPVYPVIGMVIDWTWKSTRIPLSLHELLAREEVPKEIIDQVDDVKLNIYHMHNLSKDIRARFTSDLGFVVDYLNEGTLEGRKAQKIIHTEALCEMMEALTGDTRFTEIIDELSRRQKEGMEITMCEYIDMLEARGEARGKEIGENQLAALLSKLCSLERMEDVRLAVNDKNARTQLYKEFSMV